MLKMCIRMYFSNQLRNLSNRCVLQEVTEAGSLTVVVDSANASKLKVCSGCRMVRYCVSGSLLGCYIFAFDVRIHLRFTEQRMSAEAWRIISETITTN